MGWVHAPTPPARAIVLKDKHIHMLVRVIMFIPVVVMTTHILVGVAIAIVVVVIAINIPILVGMVWMQALTHKARLIVLIYTHMRIRVVITIVILVVVVTMLHILLVAVEGMQILPTHTYRRRTGAEGEERRGLMNQRASTTTTTTATIIIMARPVSTTTTMIRSLSPTRESRLVSIATALCTGVPTYMSIMCTSIFKRPWTTPPPRNLMSTIITIWRCRGLKSRVAIVALVKV